MFMNPKHIWDGSDSKDDGEGHANSLMKVVALEIQNICFTKANESLHPIMLLHHVDDGLRYSIHKLKD
jgi:hypothetical protein